MQLNVYKGIRTAQQWGLVIAALGERGIKVKRASIPGDDISVILSGQFENPLCVDGKRVLILNRGEWGKGGNEWEGFYGNIAKHYYHEIIDATEMDLGGVVDTICALAS